MNDPFYWMRGNDSIDMLDRKGLINWKDCTPTGLGPDPLLCGPRRYQSSYLTPAGEELDNLLRGRHESGLREIREIENEGRRQREELQERFNKYRIKE